MAAIGDALEKQRPKRRTVLIKWRWLAIVSFLVIVLLVGILMAKKSRGADVDRGTRALIEAFSRQRLIEPRLSGGFKGVEFRPSQDNAPDINSSELDRARGWIMDAVAGGEAGADLAYARLLLSKDEKLNEALKYLRRAIASAPESADAHNDLGACLIQQGKIEDAIKEFETALELKADMPAALFNRALCYQRLLLRDAASDDYSRLLEIEPDASWRDEITRRHKEVSGPLAPQNKAEAIVEVLRLALSRQDTEEAKRIADLNVEVTLRFARSEAPIEYLKHAASRDWEGADRALSELKWLGRYAESLEDKSVSEIIEYLRELPGEKMEAEFGLVTEYLKAEKDFSARKFSAAGAAFEGLSKQFAARGNHLFAVLSDGYLANSLYAEGHLIASLKVLNKVIRFVEEHQWRVLRVSLLNLRGGIYSRLDQDSLAIKDLEQAKASGRGMIGAQAKASQYLGNVYWRLGNLEKALSELGESTRLYLASVPSLYELANNYLQIADIYHLTGSHPLALLFAKQALEFSDQAKDYGRAAQASSFLAVEHAQVELWDKAQEQLKLAFDNIKLGPSGYTRQLVLSRSGQVASMHGDAKLAVQCYSQAEALIGKGEDKTIPLLRILRGRSEAFARAGRFDKARVDLERAITLIEGYRAGIADSQNRSAFLDASQGVFDQMILLNMGAFGRQRKAFELSEESRARVLLDQLSSSATGAPQDQMSDNQQAPAGGLPSSTQTRLASIAEIQASLPEDLRLLAYSVTKERTYLFLITRNGFEVRESPVTTEILDRLVFDYVSVLKTPGALEVLTEQGKKLYDDLIGPIEGTLADGKALCIVPDKALHFLPFAALIDGSGRYLVESHRLTYAPSASVLVRAIKEARAKGTNTDERIVAVGNPRFDPDAYPLLKNLRDAEDEARESAKPYAMSSVVIGEEASESEVRAQLRTCDVAHLAVHCLVSEKSPWLAMLVLAAPKAGARSSAEVSNPVVTAQQSSPEDGLLYLNEIYGMSLPRARLVVLSACESGLGQYYRGEGIVSLIRPFLAARVPTVVASLWSIDSKATAELMIRFHRERKANNSGAGEALQTAQIQMIRSAEYQHPFYWAPFISVGAN